MLDGKEKLLKMKRGTKGRIFLDFCVENGLDLDTGVSGDIYFNDKILDLNGRNGFQLARKETKIYKFLNFELIKGKRETIGIRFNGYKDLEDGPIRYIPKVISDEMRRNKNICTNCGHTRRLEIDHKNGRYNTETNSVDDLQWLCKSCNDMKRQYCKECRSTGKRFDAKQVGMPVSYIEGSEDYDEDFGCLGCYLYDFIAFRDRLQLKEE